MWLRRAYLYPVTGTLRAIYNRDVIIMSDFRQKRVKRTIKTLAYCPDKRLARSLVLKSDPGVIRAISNASLNALRGDVTLTPHIRRIFGHHRRTFEKLADRGIPIERKRKIIAVQSGGAFLPILAPLLATVIGTLGSAFVNRFTGNRDEQ